mgnify:CR=1 FL=1
MSIFSEDFNYRKKNGDETLSDAAERMLALNHNYVLDFFHIPTGRHVAFKAMINSFNDQYTSEWSSENVYGRMDPISQFQGTQRVISLDWDIVASSVEEAKSNMRKIQELMSMLYPTYEASSGDSSATLISSSPLFKFKFGNFAMDASMGSAAAGARAKDAGLVGYIGGFTFEPDFESGIMEDIEGRFGDDDSAGGLGHFFPQHCTMSAEFTVLHTHKLGWEGDEKRDELFPYGQHNTPKPADESAVASEIEEFEEAIGIVIGG